MKKKYFYRSPHGDGMLFLRASIFLAVFFLNHVSSFARESDIPSNVGISEVSAQPQTKKLTGTVYDEDGKPVPGATIIIKGTTKGTVTSVDGSI